MASFAAFFQRKGVGKRPQTDYTTFNVSQKAGQATGIAGAQKVLTADAKLRDWTKAVTAAQTGIVSSRPVSYLAANIQNAVAQAAGRLTQTDWMDVGMSSNGGLIIKSKARKALAKKYRTEPSADLYRRINALRFLQNLAAAFSAFSRTQIDNKDWADINAKNKSQQAFANRVYTSQRAKAMKFTNDPNYVNQTDTQLRQMVDGLTAQVQADPRNVTKRQELYKALGYLTSAKASRVISTKVADVLRTKQAAKVLRQQAQQQAQQAYGAIDWSTLYPGSGVGGGGGGRGGDLEIQRSEISNFMVHLNQPYFNLGAIEAPAVQLPAFMPPQQSFTSQITQPPPPIIQSEQFQRNPRSINRDRTPPKQLPRSKSLYRSSRPQLQANYKLPMVPKLDDELSKKVSRRTYKSVVNHGDLVDYYRDKLNYGVNPPKPVQGRYWQLPEIQNKYRITLENEYEPDPSRVRVYLFRRGGEDD